MTKEQLLHQAIIAAIYGGTEIMSIYTDPSQDFGIERKADNSPLTLADKAAHKAIAKLLASTELPLLSEEGAHEDYEVRRQWERFWMVDPLDGTKEFIKKNGEFTVNIALIEQGAPVLGVVYVPAKDELYYGCQGMGAYKISSVLDAFEKMTDDNKLTFTTEELPINTMRHDDYVIVASRSHLSPETQEFIDKAQHEHPNVRTISSGSSIKICLVAEGSADVYPRFAPTMEWDTAAGDAVARAAGFLCYQAGSDTPLLYNKEDLHNPWFIVK